MLLVVAARCMARWQAGRGVVWCNLAVADFHPEVIQWGQVCIEISPAL